MLYIIGIGPGNPEYLLPAAAKAARSCQVLAGGRRALDLFPDCEKFLVTGDLDRLKRFIELKLGEGKNIGLLVSGDPGFYSLLPFVQRNFPGEDLQVVPGISSLQAAFAKAGIPWQEAELSSVHGRSLDAISSHTGLLGLLTGKDNDPQRVAAYLLTKGPNRRAYVGNNLSYPGEVWLETDLVKLAADTNNYENAVMIILPEEENSPVWGYASPGIPDSGFERGDVPMTKEEVRVVTLAKAKIKRDSTVYDIGAGTGSLTVEAALLAPRGRVYAVEKAPAALELIRANCRKFSALNVEVIEGWAPEAMQGLPPADVVIIGGSGGNLQQIIAQAGKSLVPGGRIVINAVTLDTLSRAQAALQEHRFRDIDIVSLAVTRWPKVGGTFMAKALNPVFIISAELRS